MKRSLLALVVLGTLVASPAWSNARTYFGFTIGISNAPPAPVFFRERPHVVFVPEERVYVVDDDDYDCDAFFTGDYWYVVDDGYWYRARSYQGPYRCVDVRYVPRRVLVVPAEHWKHHPHGGPPGLMRRYRDDDHRDYRYRYVDYREGDHEGHGHKHGHGHGHGHDDD